MLSALLVVRVVAACVVPAAVLQDSSSAPTWSVLKVVHVESLGGVIFVPLPDGSLVATGPSTEKDSYTVELDGLPPKTTGLEIEVLPDPSLPASGPGRAGGNFILSELTVSVAAKGAKRGGKPLALARSSASFAQDGWPAFAAIDGAPLTGWGVAPRFGAEHQLVIELSKDLELGAGETLTLKLDFQHGGKHTLGRFRVSATDHARPIRAASPEDERSWGDVQGRINQAIDRGCEYLLTQQLLDGSWDVDQTGYRNGGTALMVYALVKCGTPKGHPAIVRALEWMKTSRSRETYTLGCQLMALGALNDPTVELWMKECAEQLLRCQQPDGGFNYGPHGVSDLSNTQYGALGLRAAAQHGYKVAQEVWEKLAGYALGLTDDGGGGAYAPLGFRYHSDTLATGSMTAAGTGVLAICDEQIKGRSRMGGLAGSAKRGGEWVGKNFVVEANPRGDSQWVYYWLYGLERIGALLQTEEFDGHRWYREGARWLVDKQEGSGAWPAAGGGALGSTAWALLFLTRATSVSSGKSSRSVRTWGSDDPAQAISIRASGDALLTFWISTFGDAELKSYEWPGESGRGLHIKQVEWFAIGMPGADAAVSVATIVKDPGQACGRERFGGQFSFPLPGDYSLFARATVVAAPTADGAPPTGGSSPASAALPREEIELESPALAVQVSAVMDPELLQYARDPARNLLAQQKVAVSASSMQNDWWAPGMVVNGLMPRGWAAADDDANPRLILELEKPVRANVVVVTPIRVGPDRPFPAKVAVTLNGKGPPIELEIDTTPRKKSRLRLPTVQVIRKIELAITEVTLTTSAQKGTGFAEVELQLEQATK